MGRAIQRRRGTRVRGFDDELYDLLRRMLIKDPVKRMSPREVKRHPWVGSP
jgi:serine/threonine protein kinase